MLFRKLVVLFAVIAATSVGAAIAHAANTRTWVSGTSGNDIDNTECSASAPCLTFAHAIAETASGGEINCLTPGNFGAVTISMPVTINCKGASYGGIQVSGGYGDNAITINGTGPVNLIGLDLDGENSEATGVDIQSSAVVNIRDCKIHDFSNFGVGIYLDPASSGGVLVVDNVLVVHNGIGIGEYITSGATNMTVRNSNISNNSEDGILVQTQGGTHAGSTIEHTVLAFNHYGLLVSGAGTVAILGGSALVNNGTGIYVEDDGIAYSFKNNQIGGNGTDGTPLTAYPGGPLN